MKDIQELFKQLSSSPQGDFSTKLSILSESLSLSIKAKDGSLKKLTYPISQTAAKALIKTAKPAKYGLKEKTLLDSSVRNVWEIPKSRIKIDNREWNKALKSASEVVRSKLGLSESCQLKAHLHNMLVYESGQFFKMHQDSEKLDDMVATVVVVLPSEHKGGTLVVEHQGEKKRYSCGRAKKDQLSVISFFADCHHEVKPVKEGYRLTLTYNIEMIRSNEVPPSLPKMEGVDQLFGPYFHQYFYCDKNDLEKKKYRWYGEGKPKKWVYLLDHQYTQKSLRWNRLKNDDQPRVDALLTAAKSLNLRAFLSLVEVHEIWDCDDGYYSRRYNYWSDRQEKSTKEEYEVLDLIDEEASFTYWVNEHQQVEDGFSDLRIYTSSIHTTKASDEFDPFNSEYEGFMGNYGNTLERWYHRAAIVLWRDQDHDAILCDIDPRGIFNEILTQTRDADQLRDAQSRLESLLPYWHGKSGSSYEFRSELEKVTFDLALHVQSTSLSLQLLKPHGIQALTSKTVKPFAQLLNAYGASWGEKLLKLWSEESRYPVPIKDLPKKIKSLCSARSESSWSSIVELLLNHNLDDIERGDKSLISYANLRELAGQEKDRLAEAEDYLKACYEAGLPKRAFSFIEHTTQNTFIYPVTMLVTLIQRLRKSLPFVDFKAYHYLQWIKQIESKIKSEITHSDKDKNDWSVRFEWPCTCEDCNKLRLFLQDKSLRTLVWPLAKDRRRHIHGIIDGGMLAITHETMRQGTPHKLVLTKTSGLFTQSKKYHQQLKKALSSLQAIKAEGG